MLLVLFLLLCHHVPTLSSALRVGISCLSWNTMDASLVSCRLKPWGFPKMRGSLLRAHIARITMYAAYWGPIHAERVQLFCQLICCQAWTLVEGLRRNWYPLTTDWTCPDHIQGHVRHVLSCKALKPEVHGSNRQKQSTFHVLTVT